MKNLSKIIILISLFFPSLSGKSQCNFNSFTTSSTDGTCVQDGSISITIPGATSCTGGNSTTASIRLQGSTTVTQISLNSMGMGNFFNLAPGVYEIFLTQNSTNTAVVLDTIATSYIAMDFTLAARRLSCQSGDDFYVNDGEIDVNVTGGTGPFLYEITALSQTFGPTMNRTHTFTNVPQGNQSVRVTDQSTGCTFSLIKSVLVDDNSSPSIASFFNPPGLKVYQFYSETTCNSWDLAINVRDGGAVSKMRNNGYAVIDYGSNTDTAIFGVHPAADPTSPPLLYFPNIPINTPVSIRLADGCGIDTFSYITPSIDTVAVITQFPEFNPDSCRQIGKIHIGISNALTSPITTIRFGRDSVKIYRETPLNSGIWQLLSSRKLMRTNTSGGGGNFPGPSDEYEFVNGERYRVEFINSCYTRMQDFIFNQTINTVHPLSILTIGQSGSMIQGTSGFSVRAPGSFNSLDYTINRIDGQPFVVLNNTYPFESTAECDTIFFPYNFSDRLINGVPQFFVDMPLGEYEVRITDTSSGCSFTRIDTVELTDTTSYNPQVTVTPVGCGTYNVDYNLNPSRTAYIVDFRANNLLFGRINDSLIPPILGNTPGRFFGTYTNVTSGDYFARISRIFVLAPGISPAHSLARCPTSSGASGTGGRSINIPFTVPDFTNPSMELFSYFCDVTDTTSGIISVQVSGTIADSIRYSIWPDGADPNVDPPIESTTFDIMNITNSHFFDSLSSGTYLVGITTGCGSIVLRYILDDIHNNSIDLITDKDTICVGDTARLFIPLDSNLFSISWTSTSGSISSSSNSIEVTPDTTTTYYISYSLDSLVGCSSRDTTRDTITVYVDPIPPVIACHDTTIYLDSMGSFIIDTSFVIDSVMDDCAIDSVWIRSSDTLIACTSTAMVTVYVRDAGGNIDSCTSNVTVLDTILPTALCQNITVALDSNGNAVISPNQVDGGSSDNCSGFTLSLSDTSFSCSDTGMNTVTLTITDLFGNSDSCQAMVTIIDTIAPIVMCQNITIALDSMGMARVMASQVDNGTRDNCGVASITISDSTFSCADIGNNMVTLIASDSAGKVDSCQAMITIIDTIAPVAMCQNITVALDNNGMARITANQIDNGTVDNCMLSSITLSDSTFSCSDTGINMVTLVATDASGNMDSCTAIVSIIDTISPVAMCQNITVNLDSAGMARITASQVNNGSTDNCLITSMTISDSTFNCDDIGANTITFTVIDASGNMDSCTATITVVDNIDPNIITCVSNQTDTIFNGVCQYLIPDYTSLITVRNDNCTDSSDFRYTQTPAAGTTIDVSSSPTMQNMVISISDTLGNVLNQCNFDLTITCIERIRIPEFISPNEDGKNDVLNIENISSYPNNELKIFNRWGSLVYEKKGYDNTFDGKNNLSGVSITGNGGLPSGTYFYILDLGQDDQEPYTGYLQIQR